MPQPPHIAIIGAGVSGLGAAHRLRELSAAREFPIHVTVFEAGSRAGGALATIHRDGFTLEAGADSFLSEKPWAMNLAARLGLDRRLVRTQEQFRRTFVVRRGRLVPIPSGFSLMAPAYLTPVLRSPLFSLSGKARLMLEPFVPRRTSDHDESLAAFVTRRLGREVLERVAQPLAAGIYTADPATLSAHSTMPRFVEMERRHGSLIRGLRRAARAADARTTSGARWSLFVSFDTGIGALSEALLSRISGSLRLNTTITKLSASASGWRLDTPEGVAHTADAVICAAPAFAAAQLLESHDDAVASQLAAISYASAATVNLAYRRDDFPQLPDSFGFVVPVIEHRKIIAGSFSSLKFAGRAPAGFILARVFLGGALQASMLELDDSAMAAVARDEFRSLLGVTAAPLFSVVRRWPCSMPQYMVGHRARIDEIRTAAARLPNFFLAGAYLDGVGIPDCIHSGETAAEAAFALCSRAAHPAST